MDRDDYRMTLGPNRLLRVRDARDLVIGVETGTVWLTQDGDVRDIVLNAGDSFRLDRDGMVLLQALNDAAIRFAPHDRVARLDLAPL